MMTDRVVPGDSLHWSTDTVLSRPFFYNPSAVMIDDRIVAEICTVKANTELLIVACFPASRIRGAIVLVPDRGLWWWTW